ncbi:hypothetical protein HPULCUR_010592 [Helicostylum pulchrum]|uniref:F-box domain-containing protein n=1 Tax=Helicostylum pulchrum TaxID=562976 RepID=A0ABP9YDQ6_9FUNG
MERLPRETFLQIASFLDFETRFQFACACKSWHNIVSNYNLYETVYIDKDHQAPINFFHKHKELGNTVRSLQVNGIGITFSHIKQWPHYFPNLLNFSLATAEVDMFSSDYEEDEEEEEEEEGDEEFYEREGCFKQSSDVFQSWRRLESLSEFTKYVYTGSILVSGYFPNLTTIDLNFNLVPEESSDSVMDHLLMGLKNSPGLKYFKLIVAKLTLKKLDLLHHNAPSIEALVLEDIALGEDGSTTTTGDGFIPKAVSQLKRLEMQGSRYSFYENEDISVIDWLGYIAKKYPEIEVLKMNQFTPASIEYESNIIEIVQHCKQLKTFNVDVCHLSVNVLQAFDQTAIQLEKYSSQSQDLTELRNLSISKQRHSVYRVDLVIPVGNTDLVEILGQFTGLTTINTYPSTDIDYSVGKPLQIPINTFLKQHNKLEFLSLSSCVLYVDQEQQEGIRSVLDTLEMEKVTIQSQSVFDFISSACTLVKVVILTARLKELRTTRTKLNFYEHSLVYLKVYIEGHDIIELNQHGKKKEWYQLQKEEEKRIKYVQKQQEIKGTHTLAIEVNHAERIVFNLPRNPFVSF